jgi:hypothetical protein
MFKMVVDPAIDEVTYLNSAEDSMELILSRAYMTCFDNLSGISEKTSDFLCRTITGGTNIRRRFFKDDAVRTTKLWRCVILNGINSVVKKPDLLDRSVLIELKRIPDNQRKCDDDIYGKFIELQPEYWEQFSQYLQKHLKSKKT